MWRLNSGVRTSAACTAVKRPVHRFRLKGAHERGDTHRIQLRQNSRATASEATVNESICQPVRSVKQTRTACREACEGAGIEWRPAPPDGPLTG